jgi:hypothetical protein
MRLPRRAVPRDFFRITVIYLTLADAGLWKSRVVRGCAERPRVPAGVLWGHPWGRRQTAPAPSHVRLRMRAI